MPTVTFNGTRLDTNWWVTDVSRPKPEFAVKSEPLDGADGSFYRGSSLNAANVVVGLAPKTSSNIPALYDALMRLLRVDAPKKLVFGDEGGRYRMAVPAGLPSMQEWHDYSTIALEFHCPHPALYGASGTATLSTSSSSFQVGGNYPALAVVSSSDATKSGSGLWGVRFDNRAYMRVPHAASGAVAVRIDAEARTARVNGSASMVTLDSDWVELAPGSHSARIDQGGGTATLTWTERWI